MREVLTILACLLIACLTAALVGPHFVDWRAQRPWVESRLSELLGTPVRVEGDIGVQLLPTPRLELSDVHLAEGTPGAARLSGQRATFELAVGALLRGALQFSDIEIVRPRLELTLGSDGAVALPNTPDAGAAQIDRLVLRDGLLVVIDAARGKRLEIGGIALDAQADSLAGPFKATGHWGGDAAEPAGSFRLATAAADRDRLRLKLSLEPTRAPRLDLDGAVIASATPGGTRLAYQGAATVSSRIFAGGRAFPWRAAGTLDADADSARLSIAEARLGDDELALAATGTAVLALGATPGLTVGLEARQIDLDRLFADKDEPTSPAIRAVAAMREIIGRAPSGDALPSDVTVTAPTLVLGGDTATELRLHLVRAGGTTTRLEAGFGAPGGSRLSLAGTLASGFDGHADFATRDMPRLRQWLAGILPGETAPLAMLDLRRLRGRGEVQVTTAGISARDLDLLVDRSHLKGRIAYTAPASARPGRLVADLDAPALDLDGLPDLTSPAAAASDLDLDLKLQARAVRLARVGDGMIDAGRISLDLARTGPSLVLKNFAIADIGGASVTASGTAGATGGSLHATLAAERLGDLAALVGRVAPGRPAGWLAARATALSPAKLTLDMDARREKTGLLVTRVDLSGTARGTSIEAHGAPDALRPAETGVRLRLESADLPMLLRQIGFDTLPLGGLGTGRVLAQIHAAPDRPWETNVEADLGGTRLEFDGRVDPGPARARGSLRLRAGDTGPLIQALALALPDASGGRLPADLSAELDATPAGARLDQIAGTLVGTAVTGDVAVVPPAGDAAPLARAQVTGALAFDRISLPALAGLALGPPQPVKAGALWSDAPFGPALASPPDLQVDLLGRRLQLLEGSSADNAKLRLSVSGGLVALEDMSASYGGGRLGGRLNLRRDKAAASLTGEITFGGQLLDRPSLSGRLTGTLDVSSTGANAAALVAGLAGTGTLRIDGMTVPRTAADALPRLVAASDAENFAAEDATITTRLARDLDRASLSLGGRDFDVALAGGQVRLAPKDGPLPQPGGVTAQVSGSLDLRNLGLEERVAFVAPAPKDWKDPAPPRLDVVWRGALAAPRRDLEAGSVVGGLSARAIARETARIEAFESDVRERAFFIRRLKGLQFMRQRQAEIAAFVADQARRNAEEERQRQAAAALAAREAASKAEADARAQREREQQDRDINQMGSGALNLPPPRPALPVGPLPGGG